MTVTLVTGSAGFIGFHVADALLRGGDRVIGIDDLNGYYDPALKRARSDLLRQHADYVDVVGDIADAATLESLFKEHKPSRVVHLAAQPGVRYSLVNPAAYVQSNVVGFLNVLEACRHHAVGHLVYASSSSVYGANDDLPYSVSQNVDHPVSLYAATKKADELMAHVYSHLFAIPSTGLRFFTVYGPWGRPDMAYYKFAQAIMAGRPIDVYNDGQMERDFTYVDDIVAGVLAVLDRPPSVGAAAGRAPGTTAAPYRIYNIGNHQPVPLLRMIEILEGLLGKTAKKRFLPMQPGDVRSTFADIEDLRRDVGFEPSTPLAAGLERFVEWFFQHHSSTGVAAWGGNEGR